MERENIHQSALSLFIAAFDGMPIRGSRELRLSLWEVEALKKQFPAARFQPILPTLDGKLWYRVQVK